MIKIYLANLGKYNEGELVGEWFDLSEGHTLEEMTKEIGVAPGTEYEEYAIHDYEAPFEISEYASVPELIELAERLESLEEHEAKAVCAVVDNGSANTYDEACDMVENGDVHFYFCCDDMADVAWNIIEETGALEGVPEVVSRYFDYERYGFDLELEGTFLEIEDGTFIQVIS
ncbi:antirestriction protein ArdA [Priestia endophytica]|uniref:antirestriction protein ArdA n=1 Tax=Priestia endophytica TaxID=135735 RepID=UPI003D27EB2C